MTSFLIYIPTANKQTAAPLQELVDEPTIARVLGLYSVPALLQAILALYIQTDRHTYIHTYIHTYFFLPTPQEEVSRC